jgi:hypothetical protein
MRDDPEEPPGTVSDQNQEEAEEEHEEGRGEGLRRRDPDSAEEEHEGGEAGEGSQSTGHPESAG